MKDSGKDLIILETLFNTIAAPVAVLDTYLNVIKLNSAFVKKFVKIFSFHVKPGMNFRSILSSFPELQEKILSACKDAMACERTKVTIENNCEQENYYCYDLKFSCIDDQGKNLYGIACVIYDATEDRINQRRLSKQQAILANAARINAIGEMASALAHEINQPLAAINIYSHSCLEQFKSNVISDKLLNGLEQIRQLSLHAGEILHRMKNFIREGELYTEKTDVNLLIKQAIAFLDHQKTELKFMVHYCFDNNIPHLALDKIKIIQVILNLTQNSIEASQHSKNHYLVITIGTKMAGGMVEIHFKDNGPGIPLEIADKITNSYFTTKTRGAGLGLAICRTLIEAHGGKLFIKQSNRGAWIVFTLPGV